MRESWGFLGANFMDMIAVPAHTVASCAKAKSGGGLDFVLELERLLDRPSRRRKGAPTQPGELRPAGRPAFASFLPACHIVWQISKNSYHVRVQAN